LPAGTKIKFRGEVGIHDQTLTRLASVIVARHGNRDGMNGPGSTLIGGTEDRAGTRETRRRINHVGIDGIRGDAFSPVIIPLGGAIHVGEGDPPAVGVVPTVEPADVSARIEEALLDGTVDQPRDESPAIDGYVIPGILRGGKAGGTNESRHQKASGQEYPGLVILPNETLPHDHGLSPLFKKHFSDVFENLTWSSSGCFRASPSTLG
jgi:hypothetical protein